MVTLKLAVFLFIAPAIMALPLHSYNQPVERDLDTLLSSRGFEPWVNTPSMGDTVGHPKGVLDPRAVEPR
ncbi:hypothetical protein P691DRAFT_801876 [Macrolepiota fuliginosa MF-IS2]|uniref:Uncharacterized protein n=1 Tax=Macrolepiota fuliginosa MF-IS2 TaxID=1400762 RepID=A0A9P6C0V0_9AGAR|nr:hypothetical protein P691DRAFT_801876 [Macrolepiota fuliginosa MF-IS2]